MAQFRVQLVKLGLVDDKDQVWLYGLRVDGVTDRSPIELIKVQIDALVDREGWQGAHVVCRANIGKIDKSYHGSFCKDFLKDFTAIARVDLSQTSALALAAE